MSTLQPDQERLVNALVHIKKRCNSFGKTQLVKTIFLADLIHSNMCGTLMFPSPYKRLNNGPASNMVMNVMMDVDDTMITMLGPQFADMGIARQFFDIKIKESGRYKQYNYVPKVNEDLSDIPTYQLEILDAATRTVQSKGSAKRISEFTHKFSLWKNVAPNAIIPEECFQLNEEERALLSTEVGVYLTPFAQEFCRKIYTSTVASEIAGILPKLSCSYPDDPQWDEWLDAYLAWDSAMMFCCKAALGMLDDLRAKGLALVAGITCSGTNPVTFRKQATTCERECNQICEKIAQMEEIILSDTEKDSVNSVMHAIRCELNLNA